MDENKIRKDLEHYYGRAKLDILSGGYDACELYDKYYNAVMVFYDHGYLSEDLYFYAESLNQKLIEVSFSAVGGDTDG